MTCLRRWRGLLCLIKPRFRRGCAFTPSGSGVGPIPSAERNAAEICSPPHTDERYRALQPRCVRTRQGGLWSAARKGP